MVDRRLQALRPSPHETVAAAVHYRSLGRHMGIKSCPNGYELNELGTRPVPGVQGCPVRRVNGSAVE
nr:hypothetical protein [Streptomyces sp. TLI_185]